MKINFTGHHVEVTPAIKMLSEEKFQKLGRHSDKIMAIDIFYNVEKLRHIAEASIMIAKGEIRARAEADDLYTAIDDLVNKLDRQLIKHKEKTQNHRG